MRQFLDFEKPIAVLEGKIEELRHMSSDMDINIAEEVGRLQKKLSREIKTAYSNLGPWEKYRWPAIPTAPRPLIFSPVCLTISRRWPVTVILPKTMPSSAACRFRGNAVVVMGTEKGSTTDDRVKRNFGMARPEGYRKARRLMELAERFGLPVLSC